MTKDERFNSLEMKAHIKTATIVVKKGVEQTAVALSVVIGDVFMILPVVPAW